MLAPSSAPQLGRFRLRFEERKFEATEDREENEEDVHKIETNKKKRYLETQADKSQLRNRNHRRRRRARRRTAAETLRGHDSDSDFCRSAGYVLSLARSTGNI